MNLPLPWVVGLGAILAILAGLLLAGLGREMRRRRGLGMGQTVSLDRVTLTSRRLGLTGRPDRLIKTDRTIIPEEWKSSRHLRDSHRAQLGVYFLLIEEKFRVRPPYGFVVCDRIRHRVENTAELRAWVLGLVDQIREARAAVTVPLPVAPTPAQCRSCGQLANCGQPRL
jgi:CRISPR-associated exonuclease Cas4